jgi:hypothetical protein
MGELVAGLPMVVALAGELAPRAQALAGGPAQRVVLPLLAQVPAELPVQLQPLRIAPHRALLGPGCSLAHLPQRVAYIRKSDKLLFQIQNEAFSDYFIHKVISSKYIMIVVRG